MSEIIEIKCKCGNALMVDKDSDAPKDAISMTCNYCPACEANSSDYYEEDYVFESKNS